MRELLVVSSEVAGSRENSAFVKLACLPAFIRQTGGMRASFFVTVRFATVFGTAISAWMLSADAAIVDYPSAVQALNPTHYYRLDETAMGAVADTGTAPSPAAHEGSFPPAEVGAAGVPLPGFDGNNKALSNNDAGGVNLGGGSSFAADTMSVAMWFLAPGGVQIGDRLFTNNVIRLNGGTENSFQMVMPNGASGWSMAFATGNEDPQTPETMQLGVPSSVLNVQDNQWHHVVAVRNGDDIRNLVVVIDGVDLTTLLTPTSAGWGTTGTNAHLGVRADDGGSDHNHNGSIDDTAIWLNRALTVQEAQGLYNAALIPEPGSMVLLVLGGILVLHRRR